MLLFNCYDMLPQYILNVLYISRLFFTCFRYSRRVLLSTIRGPNQVLQHNITMSVNKPKRKRESHTSKDVKQPKLTDAKVEKRQRESGWLEREVAQLRKEARGCEFNKKRLRYLSDCQKIKQKSDGVLYWMSRDQRVQGDHRIKIISTTFQ